MKYIRTKDGIKECEYLFEHCALTRDNVEIQRQDIINQADTIEKLCDELVLISELEKRIIKPKELNKDCEGWTKEIGIPEGMIKVYGAIWTDNGLIYVAKMNNKGELELL